MLYQDPQAEKAYWEIVAKDYEHEEISPLLGGVKNPLYKYIQGLKQEFRHCAVDLGCGTGVLLPFLAENFGSVIGIDWAAKMLKRAKENTARYNNVHLLQMDARYLSSLKIRPDVVCSINSINVPDNCIIELILNEIRQSLRHKGLLIAIFPSFDTVLYQRDLTIQEFMREGYSKIAATKKADEYFVYRNKLDADAHLYADNGTHLQRFFDFKDIEHFLQKAGFSLIQTQKVFYPWEITKQFGYGYFPGENEIWDWFIVARNES